MKNHYTHGQNDESFLDHFNPLKTGHNRKLFSVFNLNLVGKQGLIIMLAMLFSTAGFSADRYIKFGSSGGGTTWTDAANQSNLSAFVNAGHNVYVAAGTYTVTNLLTGAGPFFISGGYPTNATGTDKTGYNPTANVTTFSPSGSARILGSRTGTSTTLTVYGVKFTGGVGSGGGGVLSLNTAGSGTSVIKFYDCTVIGNSSSGGTTPGGAFRVLSRVANTSDNILFSNCYFENNIANGTTNGGGAMGFQAETGTTLITDCKFVTNKALGSGSSGGGAIHASSGMNFTVTKSYFCENSTSTGTEGGAIKTTNMSPPSLISFSTFKNNSSNNGFALYTESTVLKSITTWNNFRNGTGAGTRIEVISNGDLTDSFLYYDQSQYSYVATSNTFDTQTNPANEPGPVGSCPTAITPVCVTPSQPTLGTVTQPTCLSTTGSFSITNYDAAVTYSVSPSTGVTVSGSGVVTAPAGSYTVTAADGACVSSASASVTVNAQPTTLAQPKLSPVTQPTCSVTAGSFTITNYDASYTYTVSPSAGVTVSAGSVTAPAGSYTVTATSGTCTSPASASATVNAQPATPAQPTLSAVTQPTCSVSTGSFTIANHNPGYTYTISPSTGVTISGDAVTAPAGSYTLTATLGACTSVGSAGVTVNSQPSTPAQPTLGTVTQPTCTVTTGSFEITNYDPSYTYTVSPSAGVTVSGSTITAPAGTYSVTATSAAACSSPASASTTVDAQPTALAQPTIGTVTQPTCTVATGSFTIANYDATYSYAVSPSAGTSISGNTITVPTGSYTITATSGTCSSPASASVVITAPTVDLGGTVYEDNTLLSDGINGTELNGTSLGLYVTLFQGSTQIDVQPVDASGNYLFSGKPQGTYKLVLGTTSTGSAVKELPAGYYTLGEGGPVTAGVSAGDGTANGETSVTANCAGITYETLRVAADVSYLSNNFGLTTTPLPVTLISFEARLAEGKVNLTWKTASEKDFSHYELQRSHNSKDFVELVKIEGNSAGNYNYSDQNPITGTGYYRLKMVDNDGSFAYSRIRSVQNEENLRTVLFPNPVSDKLTIETADWTSVTGVELINSLGQTIREMKGSTLQNNLSMVSVNPGVYMIRISHKGGASELRKIVVVK
ncbi:T9SS type A sorting domain-containing protein [Dyadobacter sp. NIV53]|uniref:T9SS type A sorting domain-containing protein n=1 Tax=Dyadobacter sp. NIV53 TaxID=2861765 RepID=UPI001C86D633|nr:T9SS type A sorting domain-containing protein [Dyadobacter sp. NIV53]